MIGNSKSVTSTTASRTCKVIEANKIDLAHSRGEALCVLSSYDYSDIQTDMQAEIHRSHKNCY